MSEETAVAIPGGDLVLVGADGKVDGLEDFDRTKDATMPMIRLNHKTGQFTDSLTSEDIGAEIEVILLGMVKQRVLWEPEVGEEKSVPLCRSYDFETGLPNPDDFPVKAVSGKIPGLTRDALEEGGFTIECAACPLKEWGTHPKQDTPWCTAQYTFPLLQRVGDPEADRWAPAVLTIQRTGIKPSNNYLTFFETNGRPLYTVRTRIILEQRHRGTVDYAVPKFVRGGDTEKDDWANFSATFKGIAGFLRTPRVRGESETTTTETVVEEPKTPASDTPEASADPAAAEEEAVSEPTAAEGTPPAAADAPADDLPF